MWDDVGISRTKQSLERAKLQLVKLEQELNTIGVGSLEREYSVTWQDWMNLRNLILVSKVITASALSRENSRGAHYREDFPEPGSMDGSFFTAVSMGNQGLSIEKRPVLFTMVKPGETILVKSV